jgi:2-polyprenyl-6-methoxyphenol hydroxylase-like FAD-dependent oxidoreductase
MAVPIVGIERSCLSDRRLKLSGDDSLDSLNGSPGEPSADVFIIGGGLSGTLAGILLARAGIETTVIDAHEVYPQDFRAEQVVGEQVTVLIQLGLLDVVVGGAAPIHRATASRRGRTVGSVTAPHYGIRYEDIVNHARRRKPPRLRFLSGKVIDLDLSAGWQRIRLSDGVVCNARLVVLATGQGRRLQTRCGMTRNVISAAHSLAFGFDIKPGRPEMFRDIVQVAYGEGGAGSIDYVTAFPLDRTLRANLFAFPDKQDPFVRAVMQRPAETLRESMPGMFRLWGGMEVTSRVEMRVNDLSVATDVGRDGVVLIGDAFQSPCPAAGTGIGRLLNDIDHLCNHYIPAWLGSAGMGAEKIAQFYDDPAKQAFDAEALRVAAYRRAFVTETNLGWRMHRGRVALQNNLRKLLPGHLSGQATMGPAIASGAADLPVSARAG